MPRGDGTGPMGMGPMTGRGAGYCAGFRVPGYANPARGFGYGFGRGYRRGFMRLAYQVGLAMIILGMRKKPKPMKEHF